MKKKYKILKVVFQSLDNFIEDIEQDLEHWDDGTRILRDDKIGVLRFEGKKDLFAILTPLRIEILSTIKNKTPESIYELASVLKRNFSSVLQDCKKLELGGFIVLEEKKKGNRDITRPMLAFDYEFIEISGMFSFYIGDESFDKKVA